MYTEARESNQADVDATKKYMEEQSGVKFEVKKITVATDFESAVNLSLSSNEDIDVILVQSNDHFQSLVQRGAFQVINEPLEKYGQNLLKVYSEDAWKSVSDKEGNIMGIPRQSAPFGSLIANRKDWREKLGFNPITSIYEFEAYLREVKNSDFDGNGQLDTIPLIGSWGGYGTFEVTLLYCFTEANPNPEENYIDENGNVVPVPLHPGYKDFLRTLARWHADGLLYPDMLSVQSAQVNDLQISNRVAARAGWWSDFIRPYEKLLEIAPDAEYEFIAPNTVNGNRYKVNTGTIVSPRGGIVSYSENADFAIKLFDWIMADMDNYWVTKQGVPGVNWEWTDRANRRSQKLKGIEKAEEGYNYYFSWLFYTPWDGRLANPGFVDANYYKYQDWQYNWGEYIGAPDWFVQYNWKDTPVETKKADAYTVLAEYQAKIILGELPVDEWDTAVRRFREMYGNEYIELATKQYKESLK